MVINFRMLFDSITAILALTTDSFIVTYLLVWWKNSIILNLDTNYQV